MILTLSRRKGCRITHSQYFEKAIEKKISLKKRCFRSVNNKLVNFGQFGKMNRKSSFNLEQKKIPAELM